MDSTTNQLGGAAAGRGSGTVAFRGATAPPPTMMLPGGESSDALVGGAGAGGGGDGDPRAALLRLAALGDRMAAVRNRIAASLSGESRPLSSDIHSVSSEISAAHLVVLNAASLLASSLPFPVPPSPTPAPAPAPVRELPAAVASAQEHPQEAAKGDGDYEVVELDAAELLTEHVHFCEICGKGFRRDANLRMHMRAHGDRFKTLDALSRPGQLKPPAGREVRFSCPFAGCNQNHSHRRFRPLKSAVRARNHFRRSHCPKLYACERCGGKKCFAILADLRSHLGHCGEEVQWRCSCGTTFSPKDKLFGHLALFEGHTPAITQPNKEVAGPTEAFLDAMEEGGIEGNCDRKDDEEGGYGPLQGVDGGAQRWCW